MKKLIIASVILVSSVFAEVIWLEEAPVRMKWEEAMKYCKDKNAILPSKEVFQKLWYANDRAADLEGFDISVSYWTSDEVKDNIHAAYPFYFVQGRDTWYYKADRYGVRCIKKAK